MLVYADDRTFVIPGKRETILALDLIRIKEGTTGGRFNGQKSEGLGMEL
jgi:hypothetical protein